jgi:hypothetical protein
MDGMVKCLDNAILALILVLYRRNVAPQLLHGNAVPEKAARRFRESSMTPWRSQMHG